MSAAESELLLKWRRDGVDSSLAVSHNYFYLQTDDTSSFVAMSSKTPSSAALVASDFTSSARLRTTSSALARGRAMPKWKER